MPEHLTICFQRTRNLGNADLKQTNQHNLTSLHFVLLFTAVLFCIALEKRVGLNCGVF